MDLQTEIQQEWIKAFFLRCTGLKNADLDDVTISIASDKINEENYINIIISSQHLRKEKFQNLKSCLIRYIRLRSQGFTTQYIFAVMDPQRKVLQGNLDRDMHAISVALPDVPVQWLTKYDGELPLGVNGFSGNRYIVRDTNVSAIVFVDVNDRKDTPHVVEAVFDSQVLNSDLSPLFSSASKTVRDAFGLRKDELGMGQVFWKMLADVLKGNFGISWKSPKDLNPGIEF